MNCSTRHPETVLDISRVNSNAFAVLAATRRCLLKAKVSEEEVDAFLAEATTGDYDHLLRTMMAWVTVTESAWVDG